MIPLVKINFKIRMEKKSPEESEYKIKPFRKNNTHTMNWTVGGKNRKLRKSIQDVQPLINKSSKREEVDRRKLLDK